MMSLVFSRLPVATLINLSCFETVIEFVLYAL